MHTSSASALSGHHHGQGAPLALQAPVGRPSGAPAGARALTLEADGSQTPAAIPTEIARRLFVQSLASPERRAAVLQALDISGAERVAFLGALGDVPDLIATRAAERRAQTASPPTLESAREELAESLNASRDHDDALLDVTYAALTGAVTPATAARIHAYVDTRVRSRIRMYSVPNMMHASGGH